MNSKAQVITRKNIKSLIFTVYLFYDGQLILGIINFQSVLWSVFWSKTDFYGRGNKNIKPVEIASMKITNNKNKSLKIVFKCISVS